jgi:hypothetical protein
MLYSDFILPYHSTTCDIMQCRTKEIPLVHYLNAKIVLF